MDILTLKPIIDDSHEFISPKQSKTFYEIGGRGYFENPLSDLLAFYFDPDEEHGFGDLFLRCFINCIGNPHSVLDIDQIRLVYPPRREIITKSGKRIDLILELYNVVIVIENKVFASVNNPFKEYEDYVSKRFEGKKPIYVILSLKEMDKAKDAEQWETYTYKVFFANITEELKKSRYHLTENKWKFYLLDLIDSITKMSIQGDMMDNEFEFVSKNYNAITNLVNLREQFYDTIGKKCKEIILKYRLNTSWKKENWGPNGVAIRMVVTQWSGKKEIVVLINNDGEFLIHFYIYNVTLENQLSIENHFKSMFKDKDFEKNGTVLCFIRMKINDINELVKQINETVEKMSTLPIEFNQTS